MPIATHEISLHGLSGAIFWLILSSLILYILGFATVGWEKAGNTWIGLWQACATSTNIYKEDWWKATQAMITIGLILLIAAAITIFIYMFIHSTSISKSNVLIAFVVLGFVAVVFMVIGFIIFGVEHKYGDPNWSFAFAVIGAILCLVASILAIVQMKKSHVV